MKIQIIGASGSGKSTLAEAVASAADAFWIDADRYQWADTDFTKERPLEERMALYRADRAQHDRFVVSGTTRGWYPEGFADRDFLVLLVLDEPTRLKRLYDRERARFGDRMLPGGDHYEETKEFLDWCATYRTADEYALNSLAAHRKMLREAACAAAEIKAFGAPQELAGQVLALYRKNKK